MRTYYDPKEQLRIHHEYQDVFLHTPWRHIDFVLLTKYYAGRENKDLWIPNCKRYKIWALTPEIQRLAACYTPLPKFQSKSKSPSVFRAYRYYEWRKMVLAVLGRAMPTQ
eukprot:TRINITY_DN67130_c9_g1_i1.p1 TRINITY_DN67130_c9_g1~~TRINITY_DN67130_c9_g1_i1.p1  ORF type:complete len:119 (+),score=0.03 TRINITY_DN67130_c9_g1_i1:29-358(+)